MKRLVLRDNIYQVEVLVYLCTPAELKKELTEEFQLDIAKVDARFDSGSWDGYCFHVTCTDGSYYVILAINSQVRKENIVITVTHEVMHATFNALSHVGVVFDPNNQEPVTYYNGWLNSQVLEFVQRELKKKSKRQQRNNRSPHTIKNAHSDPTGQP